MKKQILLLVLVLLTFGVYKGLAQTITPTPLSSTCIDLNNPLKPVPGNPYTYEVSVPAPVGSNSFHWYVTQDINFVDSYDYNDETATTLPGPFLAAGSAHYNALTPGANSISLTWQSFSLDPTEYLFVVVYVENTATAAPSCTTNNIKVYRIQPAHAFTLDIANVDSAAAAIAAANFPTCVDDVFTAQFDATFGTDGGVVYNYGHNVLYYAVAAANYSGQYNLQAQFTGLQAATPSGTLGQVANIYWDYTPLGEANGPFPVTEGATLDLGEVVAPSGGTVGQAGQMIYIKVVIHHNSFEAANNALEYPYVLAINGTLVDAAGNPIAPATDPDAYDDLHFADCAPDLFVNDRTTQRLMARPTLIDQTDPDPADNFLPIAP